MHAVTVTHNEEEKRGWFARSFPTAFFHHLRCGMRKEIDERECRNFIEGNNWSDFFFISNTIACYGRVSVRPLDTLAFHSKSTSDMSAQFFTYTRLLQTPIIRTISRNAVVVSSEFDEPTRFATAFSHCYRALSFGFAPRSVRSHSPLPPA